MIAFNKCKSFIENGQRLEYMSWRLWHRQQHDRIDNNIKQIITSLILSPATLVHDAYSHEVPQSTQKCYPSTIHHHASSTSLSRSSSFCKVKKDIVIQKEEEDYDDYYLSDEDDIYEDDIYEEDDLYDDVNYHFVKDFTKTQPRPATPRRSLLSDLLQRAPSLLSNSSCSFTSNNSTTTQNSIIIDNESNNKHNNNEWRESFHGW